MATSHVAMLQRQNPSLAVHHLSPVVRTYLKSIFDGLRALSDNQLSRLQRYFESLRISDPPSDIKVGTTQPNSMSQKWDLEDFLSYMTSYESDAMSPLAEIDLAFSMSNYFINSSHNTYLTGNQLYGDSSIETYKNVLLRGCRCIEIDIWDGESKAPPSGSVESGTAKKHKLWSSIPHSLSPRNRGQSHPDVKDDDPPKLGSLDESLSLPKPWVSASTAIRAEPRVLHGYTLTKEVSFRDVCIAIRDAAFVNNELPIIVSLEVHCRHEQQEIMVEIMKETWKGLLVKPPAEECQILPCPGDLQRKILVKVKYSPPRTVEASATTTSRGWSNSTSSSSDEDSGVSGEEKKKQKRHSIIEPLSALGVYTRSHHFTNLSSSEATVPTHVFSLSEKRLMELHESHGPTLFSHNRNFLMRAFPSGMRVSSSNLDPSVFWRKGVQMVALNWQKWDEGMMLNKGMFTGSKGWVLKPASYRSKSHERVTKIKDESQADAIPHKSLSLVIEVLAGQAIPMPDGDSRPDKFRPYVKCELHIEKPEERTGAPIENGGKTKEGEYKRRTKAARGTEPDFGGETLRFLEIPGVVEELSFLRFKINDDEFGKDDLAAWACIRLDRLQTGYRFLHLLDTLGNSSEGVLLLKIEKSLT